MKELLLGTSTVANGAGTGTAPSADDDGDLQPLIDLLNARIDEGNGEALLDIGLEDSGASMGLRRAEWDVALARLRKAAVSLRAEGRLLLTRNVGGDEEVGPVQEKDKSCSGKILVRRTPETPDDVIETRIAVVGNGRLPLTWGCLHSREGG